MLQKEYFTNRVLLNISKATTEMRRALHSSELAPLSAKTRKNIAAAIMLLENLTAEVAGRE